MPVPQRIGTLPQPPERPADAHKGTFGRALIVAGSEGMSGAACLAGYGALRSGAGLVRLAIPRSIAPIVAAVQPSWLTVPLADRGGQLAESALPEILAALAGQTSLGLGPGLGRAAAVETVVQQIYATCPCPLVVDADGLNAFADDPTRLHQRAHNAPRILTPHPGEFARLTGLDAAAIQADRTAVATEFADEYGVVLLLKGAATVIADGTQLAVNTTGNSGMATGGSGDVLTGIITGLLAQGMLPFEAAHLGAHLHGLAGDGAAQVHGERSLIADDIHRFLGEAWQAMGTG